MAAEGEPGGCLLILPDIAESLGSRLRTRKSARPCADREWGAILVLRKPMTTDFSDLNLQYLVATRDFVREDPELGAALLDFPEELAQLLAGITPKELGRITRIKPPLFVPRKNLGWWLRLLRALHEGQEGELEAVLDQASLVMASGETSHERG